MTFSKLEYGPVGFEADLPYAIAVADYGAYKVFGRLSKSILKMRSRWEWRSRLSPTSSQRTSELRVRESLTIAEYWSDGVLGCKISSRCFITPFFSTPILDPFAENHERRHPGESRGPEALILLDSGFHRSDSSLRAHHP